MHRISHKPLIEKLARFPDIKRDAFLSELETTIALGIRALVLAHLEKKDVPEFERVVDGGDDAIAAYGAKKVPNFESKLFVLLDEIHAKALQSL